MEVASVCIILSAVLTIKPDRTQFFDYESFNLSCAVPGNSSGWTVMRNTSTSSLVPCQNNWGRPNGSTCANRKVFSSDSGLYWCELDKECSNILNISVATGVVILESPALPVTEGDNVTLRCSCKEKTTKFSSSNFSAAFYKNSTLIGTQSEGKMILTDVSKEDEGVYKCKHPTKGESLQSWLGVRARVHPTSDPVFPSPLISLAGLVCTILLFTLYTGVLILGIYTYRQWARARDDAKGKAADRL